MNKAITLLLATLCGAAAFTSSARAQNVSSGEQKAAMCIGCHGIVGYQSSFPEVYKVPMIGGQSAKYMISALNAYKKGERKHPTMRAIAVSLSDADMAEIASWYEKQGSAASSVKPVASQQVPAPSPEVAALLTKGACVSCHGADYNKAIDPTYPKLAGQHADYLFAALRAYATEGKAQHGRSNAIMSAQVKQFKREELKAMANYLSTLPGELRTEPQSRFR
ncbi:MAG TPA: c-type cytochrome [Rubrivivax sp.]|nr:c-type cytochrome [Rubrivivax sp.]